MFDLRIALVLIPACPLLAAIITAVLGPKVLREKSHLPVIIALLISFVCSLVVVAEIRSRIGDPEQTRVGIAEVESLWTWAQIENAYELPDGNWVPFSIDVSLRADGLTALMLPTVTFIAMLVAIYGVGYMDGDRGYWRFFAYVSLFVFSMTMLVLVSNFLMLFVFWEAVGVCSYLLIGFWYEKQEAAAAGMKAFLVNRVGDFGFALAIFLIWIYYGTLNFHDSATIAGVMGEQRLSGQVAFVGGGVATAICLLLMLGACGKSAQFPLHVWLPDAMEGPTPVSALIHAATMVTAGVYMVTRCTPLFHASPDAQLVVACVGGFTALLAGLIALTQYDLKRVLAYSTISQLGYLFLALGTGTIAGICAAMFHLFTHAFFKALLFLGAGSVMHSMGDVIDMRRFGGLRHLMPWTHRTFLVGSLALAGVFPFAGFWSKDQIVAAVQHESHPHTEVHHTQVADPHTTLATSTETPGSNNDFPARRAEIFKWLYRLSLGVAFLTAFYTFRAYYLTFFGPEVIPIEAGDHAHESPPVMLIPLAILAVLAFSVGWMLNHTTLIQFLSSAPSLAYVTPPGYVPEFHLDVAIKSTLVALSGVAVASYLYLGHQREVSFLAWLFGPLRSLSYHKFYFDELYHFCIILPLRLVAQASSLFDKWVIDGLVNQIGQLPVRVGNAARRWQSGLIPYYSLMMALGALIILILGKILWGGG